MPGPERRYLKKALKPAIKRKFVSYLTAQFGMSIRQACGTLSLNRTVYFYQPGKPTQNAFIERFNRTYRTEILDFYLFRPLNKAREITESWLMEYNSERPHESLNNLTAEEYRLMDENPEVLKSAWN